MSELNPRAAARIRPLPPEVAERIAAGEVIERPAAVVRELLDNALDAGARSVAVEVRGGGLDLIRVSDDGWGIAADEVELAFRRHATSKLRALDDLYALRTLGFRGEALPSIAAVSETSLVTRRAEGDLATRIVVRGGQVVERGYAAREPGTTVEVRELFRAVPARLSFVQPARVESAAIGHLVRRFALAHPEVQLSLTLDGRPAFRSSPSGSLPGALAEVYGPPLAQAMLELAPLDAEWGRLGGSISPRTVTRPDRREVTLIVNGRLAASRGLLAALEAAYRPVLPRGRHPIACLRVDVPPAELDPNVHPAKTEVRLLREAEAAEALRQAVAEVLARTPDRPPASASFAPTIGQPALPSPRRRVAEAGLAWGGQPAPLAVADLLRTGQIVAQVQDTLILVAGASTMLLVDQHRAHERILYERLRAGWGEQSGRGQALLEPVVLELKPDQAASLAACAGELEGLGFGVERFGGRTFLLRTVPGLPGAERLAESLPALLDDAGTLEDGWRERLLRSLACRTAVKRGAALDEPAMAGLVQGLAATAAPAACPHGSPLLLELSSAFLRRQFRW